MAKLNGNFGFLGPLGNLSVYKRRDMPDPIMRTKGGPTKKQIKTSPRFEHTRRLNTEFGGRATASGAVMNALWHLKPLADYNIAGPVNSLLKHIQLMDTENEKGERNIVLTKNAFLLQGFSLNRKRLFNSIIRSEVSYHLLREEQRASIQIPALLPDINFHPEVTYPMYSLVATLGIIPDLFYNNWGYRPTGEQYRNVGSLPAYTDWYPVLKGSPAQTLELKYPKQPPDEAYSLLLGIGIRFGVIKESGQIEQAPYAGSAKVLAMA
jgi:hypothetical protein